MNVRLQTGGTLQLLVDVNRSRWSAKTASSSSRSSIYLPSTARRILRLRRRPRLPTVTIPATT
ncbi:hypothetical protein L836_5518, partial [Mycobacteroides abscessus MAB_110811_2726]